MAFKNAPDSGSLLLSDPGDSRCFGGETQGRWAGGHRENVTE
jgi:hypothetical protein